MLDVKPHAVVNLVESLAGRGQLLAAVPALLESLRVPFTGCSANALGVTSDKGLSKAMLERAGLPAPEAFDPTTGDDVAWIVKAVHEHASLGIDDHSIVRGARAVKRFARETQHRVRRRLVRRAIRAGPGTRRCDGRVARRAARVAGRRDSLRRLSAGQAGHRGLRREMACRQFRVSQDRRCRVELELAGVRAR